MNSHKPLAADSTSVSAPSGEAPVQRIYSVPRRYDLATLFVVSFAFAILLGAMRAAGSQPELIGVIVVFVGVVGLAQALFFSGKAPRSASVLAGGVVWFFSQLGAHYYQGGSLDVGMVIWAQCGSLGGMLAGYFAGTCIGGVFLLADVVRKTVPWLRTRK